MSNIDIIRFLQRFGHVAQNTLIDKANKIYTPERGRAVTGFGIMLMMKKGSMMGKYLLFTHAHVCSIINLMWYDTAPYTTASEPARLDAKYNG